MAKEEFKESRFHCIWIPNRTSYFAMHPDYDAKELFEALKENDIYVRFWGSERIEQYMRITVGTRKRWKQCLHF